MSNFTPQARKLWNFWVRKSVFLSEIVTLGSQIFTCFFYSTPPSKNRILKTRGGFMTTISPDAEIYDDVVEKSLLSNTFLSKVLLFFFFYYIRTSRRVFYDLLILAEA